MRRKKTVDFLTVTLFFGIILSMTVYFGLGAILGGDTEKSSSNINDIFYGDEALDGFVKGCDYRLFRHINEADIIIGSDGWLFEATDKESGYDRLLDHIGGCPFTAAEQKKIANTVSLRKAQYDAVGIEYMMIVIPDSMTVCADKVPRYLGGQSENKRLTLLNAYLAGEGISALIDPTEAMIAESGEMSMYNNTENSINAYGAYCIYNVAVSRFLADTGREVDRIYYEDIEFFTRITDGKSIAERAGLATTIKNKTVSLSDGMLENYTVVSNEKGLVITERGESTARGRGERVMVECFDDWDRIQLTPFFSNTFEKVYYRNSFTTSPQSAQQYGVTFVIQLIHESELHMLLEND